GLAPGPRRGFLSRGHRLETYLSGYYLRVGDSMPEKGASPNVHPVQRRVLRALASLSSPLLPDDYLELVNPLWSTRELRGMIEAIEPETPDAATVVIKPGYRWGGHEPGQYLRIGLDINGVRHWRAYSLTF